MSKGLAGDPITCPWDAADARNLHAREAKSKKAKPRLLKEEQGKGEKWRKKPKELESMLPIWSI